MIAVTAVPIVTSASLVANPNPIPAGQNVTLTASLSNYAYGPLSASGEPVTFYNGSTVLGTTPLNSSGQATLIVSSLPVGTDAIAAQYAGYSNFTAATSNTVIVRVNPAPGLYDRANARLGDDQARRFGRVRADLQSVNGFQGSVTLSCSGGPAGSYCLNLPMKSS